MQAAANQVRWVPIGEIVEPWEESAEGEPDGAVVLSQRPDGRYTLVGGLNTLRRMRDAGQLCVDAVTCPAESLEKRVARLLDQLMRGRLHYLDEAEEYRALLAAGMDPKELAAHCMEDIDKTFVTRVKAGDIMVGGENFGCGSSREHAPVAIKAAGIDCVIAKSFARIFYRNAINIGLPILECPAASEAINEGDVVAINFDTGVITDETTGQTFQAAPFPPFIQKIIKAGGLMKSIQEGK